MNDITITELERDETNHTARVAVKGKGISGAADVSISYHEIDSARHWNDDDGTSVELPGFLAPSVYASFISGDLVVNGKQYQGDRYSAYSEPSRYPYGDGSDRTVLTSAGSATLGYREYSPGYSDLSYKAREKLCEVVRLCADRYLTNEAAKAAYIGYVKSDLGYATREREEAEAKEKKILERLAAIEALEV